MTRQEEAVINRLQGAIKTCTLCAGSGGIKDEQSYTTCECFRKYQYGKQVLLAGIGLRGLKERYYSLHEQLTSIITKESLDNGVNILLCGPDSVINTRVLTTLLKSVLKKRYREEDPSYSNITVGMIAFMDLLTLSDPFSDDYDKDQYRIKIKEPTLLGVTDIEVCWSESAQRTESRITNIFRSRLSAGQSTICTSTVLAEDLGSGTLSLLFQRHYKEIVA